MTDLTKSGLGMTDDKTLDDIAANEASLPSVPLDDVEGRPKGRTVQFLSVLVSGVALFSDGYNIQVTGKIRSLHIPSSSPQLIPTPFSRRSIRLK